LKFGLRRDITEYIVAMALRQLPLFPRAVEAPGCWTTTKTGTGGSGTAPTMQRGSTDFRRTTCGMHLPRYRSGLECPSGS